MLCSLRYLLTHFYILFYFCSDVSQSAKETCRNWFYKVHIQSYMCTFANSIMSTYLNHSLIMCACHADCVHPWANAAPVHRFGSHKELPVFRGRSSTSFLWYGTMKSGGESSNCYYLRACLFHYYKCCVVFPINYCLEPSCVNIFYGYVMY